MCLSISVSAFAKEDGSFKIVENGGNWSYEGTFEGTVDTDTAIALVAQYADGFEYRHHSQKGSGLWVIQVVACGEPEEVTPSPSPSTEVTPSPSPSAEVTPSPSPSTEVTPSPSPSAEVTPSPSPSTEVTPSPSPSTEVTPSPSPSAEVNPNPSVSPTITIDDGEVPLAETPQLGTEVASEELVEVPEEDVPLSDVPQTGDMSYLILMVVIAIISAIGTTVLILQDRKSGPAKK
jgi:hypothetical protein